ncbi:MAG TPA: nodulation protein NfeD [Dehalococcoidia bacterium]|nr:nodulation protein NfeD [Dehalococcoidia bacterium]
MSKIIRISLLIGLLLVAIVTLTAIGVGANSSQIDVLHVKGAITPPLVDYIRHGIDQAEENYAIACIIQLDTPGGLDTSMRDIVKDIVNAQVPVVVYVSPSGSRAASAGVFITMAAHVAAMAPNTAIGAAHPVAIGTEGEAEISEAMEEKVVNDAAAYIRSIASAHGRNMEWAEKAVRESVSATEQEALELNVIDMVAPNLDALVAQLDGRQVTMLDGSMVTLDTQGASINSVKMSLIEDFLYAIADPNIAYILLSLAMLGLMVEISNPGLIFPGVVGGICLLLAFYSLGMLPVNYAGVLLIVLAFGLFIGEVLTTTFGLFTAGGITSLIIGSLILFKGGPLFQIDPWLIATVAILVGGLFAFILNQVIRAHRRQAYTGREELIGKTAVVKVALEPEGTVFLKGERWTAVSETGRVEPEETVIITKVDGLKLYVTKKTIKEVNK